jgi:hypothetical protein
MRICTVYQKLLVLAFSARIRATKTQNVYGLVIHAWARTALAVFLNQTIVVFFSKKSRSHQELVDKDACLARPGTDHLHRSQTHRSNSYLFQNCRGFAPV